MKEDERESAPRLGNPGHSNQHVATQADADNGNTDPRLGLATTQPDDRIEPLGGTSWALLRFYAEMVAAREYLTDVVAGLRRAGRDVTAADLEEAAQRYIPEPVTQRITKVIDGTAGAFVSTPPGDPHNWRLFITDTQDRITWWDGEETG